MTLLKVPATVLTLITEYALPVDYISPHGVMAALGSCCKMTGHMLGPTLRVFATSPHRACVVALRKFLVDFGALRATSTFGDVADRDEDLIF